VQSLALTLLADQVPKQMNWPEAVMMLGMFACIAVVAWAASRDDGDGVVIWFRRPSEERFVPSWKGKDQGRKAGDPWPPAPPPPTNTNDTTARKPS
jgi:hypothetical protein